LAYLLFEFGSTELSAQNGNTLYGIDAGANITTADSIVAVGVQAAYQTTLGARHVMLGTKAGYNLNFNPTSTVGTPTSQGGSVHIGYLAGYGTTSADDNVFIGDQAGYVTTGGDNVFLGSRSGVSNTSGFDNVFVGNLSGAKNTTGISNVFVGDHSGYDNTTGSNNVFVGKFSGYENTTGIQNTFVGRSAGSANTSGNYNTAIGYKALTQNVSGYENTIIGFEAGYQNSYAYQNTFVGAYAGDSNNATNSTNNAQRNTYLGAYAGHTNQTGSDNTGMGYDANFTGLSNSNTVFIGASTNAGANGVTVIGHQASGTGENAIAIGKQSVSSASNAIAIGYQSNANNANEIVFGNASHTSIGGAVNWTATSDERFKTDIREDVVGLEFINALRPVTYSFKTKKLFEKDGESLPDDLKLAVEQKDAIRYTGFLAQEVEKAALDTDFDFSGIDRKVDVSNQNQTSFTYGLRYAEFVVPLVKATQELSTKVEILERKSNDQQEQLKKYEAALSEIMNELEQLDQSLPVISN